VKGKASKYCRKMATTFIGLAQFSCGLWEYLQQHCVVKAVVCINLPQCKRDKYTQYMENSANVQADGNGLS
jgi:hypothetical protein